MRFIWWRYPPPKRHSECFAGAYAKSLEIRAFHSLNCERQPQVGGRFPGTSVKHRETTVPSALTLAVCSLRARVLPVALVTASQTHSRRCEGSNISGDPDPALPRKVRLRVLIAAGTMESGLCMRSGARTWGQATREHSGSP